MKKFTIFTFLFIISFNAFSSGVKIRKAETVAKNFLTEQLKTAKKPDLNLLSTEKSKNRDNLFYIFNFSRKPGFIIISGNDNVYPILAYSTESNYKLSDTKPDAFTDWMQSLKDQIIFVTEQKIKANKKIQNLWIYYSNPDFKPAKKNNKRCFSLTDNNMESRMRIQCFMPGNVNRRFVRACLDGMRSNGNGTSYEI